MADENKLMRMRDERYLILDENLLFERNEILNNLYRSG